MAVGIIRQGRSRTWIAWFDMHGILRTPTARTSLTGTSL